MGVEHSDASSARVSSEWEAEMASKKTYLSLLPKSARAEVETILRERDGSLAFPDLVAHRWDLNNIWRSPFSTDADRARRLDEARAALAAKHPAWTPAQVEDAMRLWHVSVHLRDIAIARRCAWTTRANWAVCSPPATASSGRRSDSISPRRRRCARSGTSPSLNS